MVNSVHYNWRIVGSGWIAHDMAKALIQEDVGIYGVASGHYSTAKKFSEEFSIEHVYENYQAMFEDENIDIVYIATPHNSHYEIMKNALFHNKHVFCEKAITLNYTELDECVKIAKEKHLVISDGVTIFHMPLFKELKKVISSNSLGPVKMIQVNFGSFKEYDVNNRFFNPNLAGGALLDIGVYAVSFARWFIMQSKNTRDFSYEMNWMCRCWINNLKINDKYDVLNIYICYNIDEENNIWKLLKVEAMSILYSIILYGV